jgi:PAS domain-containing protein
MQTYLEKVPEEVFNQENAAIVNEVDERTLNGEKVNEIRSLSIAGRTYTLQTIQVPLRDADGNITGISGIVRDMTDVDAGTGGTTTERVELIDE